MRFIGTLGALLLGLANAAGAQERDYLVFAASEATDEITLIRFNASGGKIERKIITGVSRTEPDGPHGLAVSPDGRHYYVSTAHGTPFGYLFKYTTVGDTLVGRTELGNFPASLQISPNNQYAFVVNFNLHGDMVPSSVSIVSTNQMVEIARPTTCTMPHGSRLSRDGSKHYSVCMMDEMLIEIDTRNLDVSRHFMLSKGSEHGMPGVPRHGGAGDRGTGAAAAGAMAGGHGMHAPAADNKCSPTWAAPSPTTPSVFVACNASNDIVEVNTSTWSFVRRIPAGDGVYNLALTRDGRLLIATNKRGRSVSIIDVASGREMARIATQRTVVHGAAISDDDRYAFISVEGYGAEPGTVEMIDLRSMRRVASVDIGQMAGGIDFWRSEPR